MVLLIMVWLSLSGKPGNGACLHTLFKSAPLLWLPFTMCPHLLHAPLDVPRPPNQCPTLRHQTSDASYSPGLRVRFGFALQSFVGLARSWRDFLLILHRRVASSRAFESKAVGVVANTRDGLVAGDVSKTVFEIGVAIGFAGEYALVGIMLSRAAMWVADFEISIPSTIVHIPDDSIGDCQGARPQNCWFASRCLPFAKFEW